MTLAPAGGPTCRSSLWGTANHYFLDAIAGAVVMALGLLLTRPALRVTDLTRARVHGWVRDRRLSSTHAGTATIVSGGCETSTGERIPRQPSRGGASGDAATASAQGAATAEDSAPAAAC